MSELIKLCTQIPVPGDLLAEAVTLAEQENPANTALMAPEAMVELAPPDYLALPRTKMWAPGRSLRVRLFGGSPLVRRKVMQYAVQWCDHASIDLRFVDQGPAEIRVTFVQNNRSWSYIGTDCLTIRAGEPTMNFGWFNDQTEDEEFSRTTVHEFGHALGCIHEHQSPAADIPWDRQKVYQYYRTLGWGPADVDNNVFRLYSRSTTQFSAFDPESIMLYAIPAELTTNGFSIGWNTRLSTTDESFIATCYPRMEIRRAG